MKRITTLLFLAFSLCITAQNNQTVFNDLGFNAGGTGFQYIPGNPDRATEILVQPDSKIIVAGRLTAYNNTETHNIIRLNEDGFIDDTFVTGTGFNGNVNAMLFLTPETILVGGNFTEYNGTTCSNMIVLNLDGSVNSLTLTGTDGPISDIIVQPDGKILFTGDFTSYNGIACNHLGRLNADGNLDNTFNISIPLENLSLNSLALQSSGKVIAGGYTFYRFNTDGSQDMTFVDNLNYSKGIKSIYIDADDNVYIGGHFRSNFFNPESNTRYMAGYFKLNSNGTVDESFQVYNGFFFTHDYFRPTAYAIKPYQNSLMISGFFGTSGLFSQTNFLAVVDNTGNVNSDFRYGNSANLFELWSYDSSAIFNFALLPDGNLIAIGDFRGGIFKINMPLLNNDNLKTRKHDIINYNSGSILKLLSNDIQIKSVSLYDMSGRKVYQNQRVNANEVTIANLSSGVYNAIITTVNGSIQKLKCIKY